MSAFVTLSNFFSRHAGTFIFLTILLLILLGAAVFLLTRVREGTIVDDVESQLQTTTIEVSLPKPTGSSQKIIDEKRLSVSQPSILMLEAADDKRSPITFPLLSTSWMEGSPSSSTIGESYSFDELADGEDWWGFNTSLVQAVEGVPPIVGVHKPLLHTYEAEKRVETECSVPPAKSMECVFVNDISTSTTTTKIPIRSPRVKKEPTNECWWASPASDKENRRFGTPSRSGMLPIAGLKRSSAKRETSGAQRKNDIINRPPWGSAKGLRKTVALKSSSRGALSMRN
ncbi:hypothetical protein L218DRAFT_1079654 [Marasmius fiardii PR-910]|nr:hypothetical protein L218DRAFT_1079654 [Marasmius fiardii PR-910]